MPNYCYNYVRCTCSNINVIEDIVKSRFNPEILLPVPELIDEDSRDGWRANNYGPRWIVDDDGTQWDPKRPSDDVCEFLFVTAWNPPLDYYENLLRKYQGLKIYYEFFEYDMGFCGYGSGGDIVYVLNKTFYKYETKEEFDQICEDYEWTNKPWDPYFTDDTSDDGDVSDAGEESDAAGESDEQN